MLPLADEGSYDSSRHRAATLALAPRWATLIHVSWTDRIGLRRFRQVLAYGEAMERALALRGESADDPCEANRRAHLIGSELSKVFALLESHEEGRSALASYTSKFGRTGVSAQDATTAALHAMFSIVANAAIRLHADVDLQLEHAHPSFLDQEEAFALTHTYPDGSALIRISTSLITACDLVAATGRILAANPSVAFAPPQTAGDERARADVDRACVAALRYYLIHQRTFGLAGKVMPPEQKPRWTQVTALRPAAFVMAHELGHHLLRHVADEGFNHDQEIAADVLASGVVRLMTKEAGGSDRDAIRLIWQALVALSLHAEGLFVRAPGTHPDLATRWVAIIKALVPDPGYGLPTDLARLLSITREALNTSKPLDESDWESLWESQAWDTSFHDASYQKWVRGLDLVPGYSHDQTLAVLSGLSADSIVSEGLLTLWAGSLEGCLGRWDLCDHPYLRNHSRPLAHYELAEILAGTVLAAVDEQGTRQTVAAILASELSEPIRRAS